MLTNAYFCVLPDRDSGPESDGFKIYIKTLTVIPRPKAVASAEIPPPAGPGEPTWPCLGGENRANRALS